MAELDDHQLLAQFARENSEAAFAALVERHVNLVYSVAWRGTGNAHAAEEITQAVFIILGQKARRISGKTILTGWLYQTTRLTVANFLRGEIRRQKREQEAYMQSTLNQPDAEVWPQIAPLLDDALARLGERDRNAIVLRFFENKNLREVGLALGASEDAAKMRVNRALEKLRKIFTKRGVTLSAAIIAGAVAANSVQAAPVGLAKTISAVALTKGAVAGSSTLTLVKGALKIMAWTKAKTVIVVTAGILLAAGTTTLLTVKMAHKPGFQSADPVYEKIWSQPNTRSLPLLNQAPAALIIRPTHYPDRGGGIWGDDGKFVFVNTDVTGLIGMAWSWGYARMVLPPNLPPGNYDLMATLPDGRNSAALKDEITKHFGLTAHKEIQETDVLRLQIADSARLQPHRSRGGSEQAYMNGDNTMQTYHMKGIKLSAVVGHLEGWFKQPLLDGVNDGLEYNFDFQWGTHLQNNEVTQALRTQLEQFGLELVPAREPVEMLVVEKVKN
jgi:uncharacterized protein (TIGR03435 family)